jgi:serine/threonine protein kinase
MNGLGLIPEIGARLLRPEGFLTKTRKMADQHGGKLIGQGKFGCVFDTVPRCRRAAHTVRNGQFTANRSNTRRAVKILPVGSKVAETEIKISRALSKLTGYDDYFILVDDVCEGDDITGDPDWAECRLFNPERARLARFVQLRMAYGGIRLSEYARSIDKLLAHWLDIQIHVFEGVRLLHSNRWIHGDLHFGNILIDDKNLPRIIDFGLGYNINLLKEKDIINLAFLPKYDNYPPEFDYVSGLQKGMPVDTLLEDIYNNKRILQEIDEIFPGRTTVLDDMKQFASRNPVKSNTEVKEYIQAYARPADIWTLGYNFYKLYILMLTFPVVVNSKFYRTLHREQMNLLRGLLVADPRRRLTAEQALTELYTMRMNWN